MKMISRTGLVEILENLFWEFRENVVVCAKNNAYDGVFLNINNKNYFVTVKLLL